MATSPAESTVEAVDSKCKEDECRISEEIVERRPAAAYHQRTDDIDAIKGFPSEILLIFHKTDDIDNHAIFGENLSLTPRSWVIWVDGKQHDCHTVP